ncbi:sulfate ABC transporter permease [Algoriphagus sp.]|uniref:sulfate ABC transporter permease n=1 Tax=Algoriphagus sp. TaxID=1872435 RepID=UPI00261B06B0|nr:sulfate ABC transporter permease [Algoriphagus sp.]
MPKDLSPLAQRVHDLIDFDKRVYFFCIVLLFILIRYLTNELILEAVPNSQEVKDQGAFTFFYIYSTLGYLWTPFELLWKFTLISFLLWLGAFSLGYKIPYKSLWQFVLVAEFIFIFPELIRFLVYINPETAESFSEIKAYRPLSVLSLAGYENVALRLRYPLATLNLFELLYMVLLTIGIHSLSGQNMKKSALVVVAGYLIPMAIWLTWFSLVYRD